METEHADRYLIEQIRGGQESAWRNLIDRYEGRLLAFARSRVAARADAEDLVQEVFVGFAQSLANYDENRDLETYLFTILRYKMIDLFRKRKDISLGPLDEDSDSWDERLPDDAETPSRYAARAEDQHKQEYVLADILRKYILECRDRDAFDDLQVIELLFYAGKRNLDVAELLDLDQKAIAGIKFRAIRRLRKFIEELELADIPGMGDDRAEFTVSRVWRENRLTCLKRGTLGSYLLGVLEEPWLSYTQFHLDVVGCDMCLANLQDLQDEETGKPPDLADSIFKTSMGFLSRRDNS